MTVVDCGVAGVDFAVVVVVVAAAAVTAASVVAVVYSKRHPCRLGQFGTVEKNNAKQPLRWQPAKNWSKMKMRVCPTLRARSQLTQGMHAAVELLTNCDCCCCRLRRRKKANAVA